MAQYFSVHPENPQPRLIRQAAAIVRDGGVIVYPTDSCYALGCRIGDKEAAERIREIRGLSDKHHFSLLCRDLREIAHYAKVDNPQYRLMKATTPGSYTFLLEASREVPRRLQHPKCNTIGLRIPDNAVVHALLSELDEPLLSSSLILPGQELPMNDPAEIREVLEHSVDLVIDGGPCGIEMTTVLDLTGGYPSVVRVGKGTLESIGVTA